MNKGFLGRKGEDLKDQIAYKAKSKPYGVCLLLHIPI